MYFLDGNTNFIHSLKSAAYHKAGRDDLDIESARRVIFRCEAPMSGSPVVRAVSSESMVTLDQLGLTMLDCEVPSVESVDLTNSGLTLMADDCPGLATLLSCALSVVLVGKAPHGSSISSKFMLGTVWVAPAPNWSPQDAAEALFHEFVHTVTFLDEVCHQHFTGEAAVRWARTAIRGDQRELYAVAHSVIVASELVELRRQLGLKSVSKVHGRTEDLVSGSLAALTVILAPKMMDAMGARMVDILHRYRSYLESLRDD